MKYFLKHTVFLFVLLFIILPEKTYAYLDPGTGSYLLQIMAAAFFGGIYAVSMWWKQIKTFFTHILRKDKKTSEKSSEKHK